MIYGHQREAFSWRLVNGMNWEVKEKRQGHDQKEGTAREGGRETSGDFFFCLLPFSNSHI